MARLLLIALLSFLFASQATAALPLSERLQALEAIIGGYPPQIKSKAEEKALTKRYKTLKARLDSLLQKNPDDLDLLMMRGHLQQMGHNFDYPGAWEGARQDLQQVLRLKEGHVPALLELGLLLVNTDMKYATKAEELYRAAQCYAGATPLEEAQRGLYFALYYQGKVPDALRQANYLVKTWPSNEAYQEMQGVARHVLLKNHPEEASDQTLPAPIPSTNCVTPLE